MRDISNFTFYFTVVTKTFPRQKKILRTQMFGTNKGEKYPESTKPLF